MRLLESSLVELHETRTKLEGVRSKIKTLKEDQKRELENLLNSLALTELEKEELEHMALIETLALEEYQMTQKKTLTGGLKIQERSEIKFSEADALKWAIDHKLFLKLDNTSFKAYAKKNDLDFVTISKNNKVTFPSVIKIEEAE